MVEAKASVNPSAQQSVRHWLDTWPLPFLTLADARIFFGGNTLYAETWLEVLEERPDGYWPQFHMESMVQSIEDQVTQDYWSEWQQIQCPTLVVGGAKSFLPQVELQEMARSIPHGYYVQIPNARHDLHLEQPDIWRQVAEPFVCRLSQTNQMG